MESKVLSRKFSTIMPEADEQPIIRHIESVLVPAYHDDLTTGSKIAFTLVWAVALTLPVMQFLYFKGYF